MQASGIVHHLVVSFYSLYLMYNSCSGGPAEAPFYSYDGSFSWWKNPICMMQIDEGYVYNIVISMAFMFVELYILKFQIQKPNKLQKQTICHHIIAITGFFMSMVAGYGFPGLSSAALLCEVSSVFLYMKDMFNKETRNTAPGQIVQILFFICYTFLRVLMFPYLTYVSITMGIL